MKFGPRHYRLTADHKVELVPIKNESEFIAWATEVWGNDENRRVAFDEAGPGVCVSTVFLGVDHQFGDGPPLLFETMTFVDGEGGETWRWSTWDEAVAGHADAVASYRRVAKPPRKPR